jgi:hypothetical protein
MKHLHHGLQPLLSHSDKFPQANPLAPGAWGHCLRDERGAAMIVITLALAAVTRLIVLDVGGLLTVRRLGTHRGRPCGLSFEPNSKKFRPTSSCRVRRDTLQGASGKLRPLTVHAQTTRSLGGRNEI